MKHWEIPWVSTDAKIAANSMCELVDSLGTTDFPLCLYRTLDEHLCIEVAACSSVNVGERLHSRWIQSSSRDETGKMKQVVTQYAATYYKQDPLWKLIERLWGMDPEAAPLIILHTMNATDIPAGAWRQSNYLNLALGCRTVLAAAHPRFGALTLSLFRADHVGEFGAQELAWLNEVAPLLFRLLFRHEGIHFRACARLDVHAVEQRLTHLGNGLTPREIQVCSEIVIGTGLEDIARKLGIKHASVKTFRNRAFDKLGIASRTDLYAMAMT